MPWGTLETTSHEELRDVERRQLNVDLSDEEIVERVAAYVPSPPTGRVRGKYARHVGSATQGAPTS